MKMAISADGQTLENEVDPRFGRCPHFVIADTETQDFTTLDNSSAGASGGAGIAAAQMIVKNGIEAVLTGNCGPNAHQVLSSAGIKIITGVSGKIKDAIAEYKLGSYTAAAQANVPDHFGMGGCGGRGGGRGVGKGMGAGRGVMPLTAASPSSLDREQELANLKDQSEVLARQLAEIQHRLKELVKKDN